MSAPLQKINHRKVTFSSLLIVVVLSALVVHPWTGNKGLPTHAATAPIIPGPQIGTSQFNTGVDVQQNSYFGTAANNTLASNLINASTTFVNVHLMGSGLLSPQPCPYGAYDWTTLDKYMTKIGTPDKVVFQAFQAPTWMLKAGNPSPSDCTTDFKKLGPPTPDHDVDFANLVAAAVQKYPQIKYVEVWNEFSGLFINTPAPNGSWDSARYTAMYNQVYDAVKGVRSDVQVGGPYIVIGSNGGTHPYNSTVGGVWGKFDQRMLNAVMFWLKNKHGADFITVDGSSDNFDAINPAGATEFSRLDKYPDFANWVRTLDNTTYPGAATLPIWQAEWYAMTNSSSDSFTKKTAYVATGEIRSLKAGIQNLRMWGTEGCYTGKCAPNTALCSPEFDQIPVVMPQGYAVNGVDSFYCNAEQLTSVNAGPPKTTALYAVQKYLHDYFGPGTALYDPLNSNANVETLASASKVLLVNKTATIQTADVYGNGVALTPYQVLLTDVPHPDLVIVSATTNAATIHPGDPVSFSITVKNQGNAATPSGVLIGANFSVDGTSVSYSNTDTTSLNPGATVTLTANGGTAGATWAATIGAHTLTAVVDGINRISEGNDTNNTFSLAFTVLSAPIIIGDFDGNGTVDINDVSTLLSAWGTNNAQADLKPDGIVNVYDLSVLLSHWTG